MKFADLIGRTVTAVDVEKGEHFLRFITDAGPVVLVTDGDCCSETWFADITGFDALIGSPVLAVEEPDMPALPDGDKRSRQEFDQQYGIKITTAKGYCDIVYRNSSNGYYGGGCSVGNVLPGDAGEMVPVTGDWSAS